MEKTETTLEDAKEHKLTEEEFHKIQEFLGRIPNSTELGIYSALWSEHCSYKNSILLLKTLPTKSPKLLAGAGEENAGAMDIGDGLAVVFKIESHNHPTAVEPYQGAATGVGGIMRDIFTMGARPIVSLNSLRFGPPNEPKNRYLLTRAVKGIGDYGNALGIAVGGGELFIHPSFSRNPLVNAMTVGIAPHNQMASASTKGKVGYRVFLVGATTGRDGIHGASFASQDLTKETEEKKSAVQVGDPFMEKLLMEASLDAIQRQVLVGIQDMGAAGISCATSEMSARGNTGMEIDLDKVPLRETGMNAYEIMLSESQERMLVVAEKGKEEDLTKIFEHYGLLCVEIGVVTADGILRVKKGGITKAEIPALSLVLGGGAPRYKRETRRPEYLDNVAQWSDSEFQPPLASELHKELLQLLGTWNICHRKPIIEQYDTEVGLVKVIPPGGDGGVVRIPDTNKGIAVTTDCNSRYTFLDPYLGTSAAVCEAARNIAVTGATPYGVTNNLNFGNPYIPENYYIFSECIRGMSDACKALGLPVTGGNVSFYNESSDGPILPTPTIGMVGLIDDIRKAKGIIPRNTDREYELLLFGDFQPSWGGSEYLAFKSGKDIGKIPFSGIEMEKRGIDCLLSLHREGWIESAKDLSLGGLLTALAKMALHGKILLQVNLESLSHRGDLMKICFGETSTSFLVSVERENLSKVSPIIKSYQLDTFLIGTIQPGEGLKLKFKDQNWSWTKEELQRNYESALEKIFSISI